ncbi:OmpA family protein [Loktanella sp. DJP18]|uniref:OmpA family protein n=1 Tax=Loktanella sp. DJP18 TaxID=3409788 RepID=UPI003BB4D4A0
MLCASPVTAQEVTITSAQGNLTLTGRIAGFDGTYLDIESPYGPLSVIYADVTCDGAACPDPLTWIPHLRLSGEPRLASLLLPALFEGYAREAGLTLAQSDAGDGELSLLMSDATQVTVLRISLRSSKSAEAFADLLTYDADVALTFREPLPAERTRAAEVGITLPGPAGGSIVLGGEALVPIVSPLNPMRTADPAKLIGAFTGRITDWTDMGQSAAPMTLHLGPDGDGQADAFLAMLPGTPSARIIRHADAEALASAVAADPAALGITALNAAGVAQAVGLRDACGLTAAPVLRGIKTHDYPLTTPAFAFIRSERQPAIVGEFLAWLRSPSAQLIVRRAGLADQGVVPITLDDQGERFAHAITIAGRDTSLRDLQGMVAMMHARVRVSLTFRFANGSTTLDAASAANLRLLAHDIRNGVYAGREVLLIGFSDGEGPAMENRDLSVARALAIESALLTLLGDLPDDVRIGTTGFGEALPIGCDDTPWGRQMNRRVEVWVGD